MFKNLLRKWFWCKCYLYGVYYDHLRRKGYDVLPGYMTKEWALSKKKTYWS